jgi:hypothetical protein
MTSCTGVTQRLPNLITALKEKGFGQWPKITSHGVGEDESIIGYVVDP